MCHRIVRYSEQILVRRPARQPQLFRQRKAWQRSLEKVPAGRDVLYNSDMVTLTALLSQQIAKTVAFTSINAGFMIPPPPPPLSCFSFYSPRLPLFVRVTASLRDNYWDVLVQLSFIDELDWSLDTLCWCMALALSFFSHLYSSEAHHRDYSHRVFYIWLNKKSSSLPVFVWVFKSFVFFPLICCSAKGPEPPVAKGGMEPRLHPAGLRRQHWHRAAFRPHGKRTLCHPSGNHASLPSLTTPNNPFPP